MSQQPQPHPEATRRAVLAGVGLAGLAGALAGCSQTTPLASRSGSSGSGSSGSGSSGSGSSGSGSSASSSSGSGAGGSSASGSSADGAALASTGEIPVGGGMVFSAQQVVVTQPKAGEFKAFSAVCTHAHCLVDQVSGGTIDCPCHGSAFSVTDGAVVRGPAPSPLPAKAIKVEGGKITLG